MWGGFDRALEKLLSFSFLLKAFRVWNKHLAGEEVRTCLGEKHVLLANFSRNYLLRSNLQIYPFIHFFFYLQLQTFK